MPAGPAEWGEGGGDEGAMQLLPRFWHIHYTETKLVHSKDLILLLATKILHIPPCFEEILLLPKNRIEPLWCSITTER